MQDHPVPTTHRAKVAEDILCGVSYITMFAPVVMLLIPRLRGNRRIRFHACQSVLVNWLLLVAGFFFHLRAGIDQLCGVGTGSQYTWTARILSMSVWAIASLWLARGYELRIPFISSLAERQADAWLFRWLSRTRTEGAPAIAGTGFSEAVQLSN